MNEGVDQVRKAEFKYREDLKGSRYLWLKRKKDLPFLFEWVSWVKRSTLEPMKKVAATIERHWRGIIRWFESRINNGILEGINSLIQAAKRKARGYRTTENLIAMIYLIVGKIDLQPILEMLPT